MIKKILAWLHLWLGLVAGIIVVILSLTGCILVFEPELRDLTTPWYNAAKPEGKAMLPPSVIYRAAAKALPGKELRSVWYHGEGRTAHVSVVKSDSTIFVDPYTAEVLRIAEDHDGFFEFVKNGHYYIWFPEKIGHHITGWGTFIFAVLLITGIVLWWPKRWNKANTDKSFKIKWSAKFKRVNYDLHNVLGFYSLIVAGLLAFTGLMMSFAWFHNSVYWINSGGETKVRKREKIYSDTTKTMQLAAISNVDRVWHLGMTQIGEHNKDQIIVDFPKKASDPLSICIDMYDGTWRYVYFDQHTLKQLPASELRLRDEKFADWVNRANYGIHVGAIIGMPSRIAFFLGSLICASLPITGFYIWWGKRKKGKKKVSGRKKSKPPVQAELQAG
ncbi:PepSY-associated TM helix domain-containing protein [Mucilaginibacter pedocola]|uniref:Peptidase n=1 Tax=Mucilaginibacter pedocola TaxID=1792845 RepID=A0A1S9PCS5_9SPHI|nr:PepSY-associated TM helix domain-containing protein [Mucilaginibacter pedocola]OOQ58782.1 hypothetical protein BC343_09025 [Mucilaginibacter pedocola]